MNFVGLSLLLALSFALAACSSNENAGENTENNNEAVEEKGELVFGYNNWSENIAVTNMWKILLEEQGYEVELKSMEKSPVWAGIAGGDLDVAAEVWLPITDEPLYEEYKEDLDLHETWYEGTGLGLVVPAYMNIDSIDELNDNKDLFEEAQIVGIDPGASLMRLTNDTITEYGLDYELIESSGPAMMTELDKAYEDEEPIVVTLWNPHWAFADYDLKYLEDPKNVYGDPDDIYYMTRKGFEADHPEVVTWMNNWQMDDASLGSLMSIINEEGDAETGAKKWIEENRDLVDEWVK
ncbi:glycine/betaine ABC transporter [Bacillus taeanensis]|uniref:Glycine/betaine ABC transporter n=2 Tax=Bacillus taeanensis TaxID=273032 RepID=A0A366XXT4_9BACI|nr:glycine/betaine ABC transporter [Bacillus taeanensis]